MRHPKKWLALIVLALLVGFLVTAPGCEVDDAQQAADYLSKVARMPPGELAAERQNLLVMEASPERDHALRFVENEIRIKTGRAPDEIKPDESALDTAADTAQGLGPVIERYVPAPWNVFVPTGIALLAGIRNVVNKSRGKRIVRAIELVKDAAGNVNFKDPEVRKRLDVAMGASGKRLVDEAQGDKLSLPL